MITLLIFIAVLAVLVLSHEFGHFIVARKNGIKVHEFGFGFPPRLFGVRRTIQNGVIKWQWIWGNKEVEKIAESHEGGTLYSFNLIPLGGFVKIKGEDASGAESQDPDSFSVKKAWQKAAVLIAGVVMNILVAAVLLSIGFMVGLPQAVDVNDPNIKDRQLQIVQVLPGKPAETAGIKVGDVVISVDGAGSQTLTGFQGYVDQHKNQEITVVVKRGNETLEKKITPVLSEETQKGGIGVALAEVGTVRYPWYKAIYYGVISTGIYLREIFAAFFGMLAGLVSGRGAGEAVSGPVGVAVMTGQVARMGIVYLLQFTALLSLNLAALNVLPIPALDGGRLLFVIIAKIIRRPVTPRYEQIVHATGFMLLMLLVLVITIKDINTFTGIFKGLFN